MDSNKRSREDAPLVAPVVPQHAVLLPQNLSMTLAHVLGVGKVVKAASVVLSPP
jgi:hypothetical protein